MAITSTEIQNKVKILKAYFVIMTGDKGDKIRYGAAVPMDMRKVNFIISLLEDIENQESIATSADEYCLTEDDIDRYFDELPDLIGGSCINIYDIDLDELSEDINAVLLANGSFVLLENGNILLLG